MEGDNVYVYKVDKENTVKKVAVEIGLKEKRNCRNQIWS